MVVRRRSIGEGEVPKVVADLDVQFRNHRGEARVTDGHFVQKLEIVGIPLEPMCLEHRRKAQSAD